MKYWLKKFSILLFFVLILFKPIYALKCFNCILHGASGAKNHIYNRILASPYQCDKIDYCEGKWCFQRLDDTNVTFGCTDYAYPLGDTLVNLNNEVETIESQCRAYFTGSQAQIYHAVCYCRISEMCNSAIGKFSPYLIIVFFVFLIKMY